MDSKFMIIKVNGITRSNQNWADLLTLLSFENFEALLVSLTFPLRTQVKDNMMNIREIKS